MNNEIKTIQAEPFLGLVKNAQLWALANEMLLNGIDLIHQPSRLRSKRGITRFYFHRDGRFGFIKKEPWGNFSVGVLVKGEDDKVLFAGVETPRLDHVLGSLRAKLPEGVLLYQSLEELWLEPRKYLLIKSK